MSAYDFLKELSYTCQFFKGAFLLTCQHLIKSFCFYILYMTRTSSLSNSNTTQFELFKFLTLNLQVYFSSWRRNRQQRRKNSIVRLRLNPILGLFIPLAITITSRYFAAYQIPMKRAYVESQRCGIGIFGLIVTVGVYIWVEISASYCGIL